MKKLLTLSAVAFLLAALGSCSGSTTATQSMEERLATIDGSSSAEPYAALLNEVAPRCQESRDDIGDMTVKAVELVKKANKE